MTKLLFVSAAIALAAIGGAARAEIMCTERQGCWETGKRIRLMNQRNDTQVMRRDGKGYEKAPTTMADHRNR
jgi:hypothetical protein